MLYKKVWVVFIVCLFLRGFLIKKGVKKWVRVIALRAHCYPFLMCFNS